MRRTKASSRSGPVLLLLVGLGAGCDRSGTRDLQRPWFESDAAGHGLSFRYDSGHRERYLLPEILGGGAALFDMDADGDLDAYLVQGGSLTLGGQRKPGNALFQNEGGGRFTDVSAGSGADAHGVGMGVAVGDADGDGDPDLYLTNVESNLLLANEGAGRFRDVSAMAGVRESGWSTGAAFFDYDRDGDLDLFVVNLLQWPLSDVRALPLDYCEPEFVGPAMADTLYRNASAGIFENVSRAAGLETSSRYGMAAVAGDFDQNGWSDVFVVNAAAASQLWLNLGEERFEDGAEVLGCAFDENGMAVGGHAVAAADLDGDGDEELLVVGGAGSHGTCYLNDGGGFRARSLSAGAPGAFTRFGFALADFDDDGRLDLYQATGAVRQLPGVAQGDPYAEPDLLFRGVGATEFVQHTLPGGVLRAPSTTARAVACGDVDGDGGLDLLVVNRDAPASLLLNVGPRGYWIAFRVLEASGRDAYGARVVLTVGDRRIIRRVRAAAGYLTSNDPTVHVGLGVAEGVRSVVVEWGDGSAEAFGAFSADRTVVLRRGRGRPSR